MPLYEVVWKCRIRRSWQIFYSIDLGLFGRWWRFLLKRFSEKEILKKLKKIPYIKY